MQIVNAEIKEKALKYSEAHKQAFEVWREGENS